MPAADWTSIGNGASFAIIADGTSPSPPDVMQITGPGGQAFENITGGPFKDSRVSAWTRLNTLSNSHLYLILRSQDDTTFIAAPATFFLIDIINVGASMVRYRLSAVVNGVVTLIVVVDIASLNGNPDNTWQQYQFSSFNSGTDMLLRVAQWNGAAFVPVVDAAAPIASFPALDAAGACRFGASNAGPAITLVDDVNYYSLT